MECGYGKVCINPPLGIAIGGSYDIRPGKGFLDDLYARSVAFSDGERSSVIVSVDLCHMETAQCDYCRDEISKAAGIDRDAIIIVCTHTHAGPDVYLTERIENGYPEIARAMREYIEFLCESIVKSALLAVEDLKPSKLYSASARAEGIANVRRYKMKDGTTVTNPGAHNPNVDRPIGKPNETVKLLKVVREDANDIYVVNFAMHGTTVKGRTYYSADYPGVVCSTIEAALGGVDCIFLQGACGDVVQINAFPTPEIKSLISEDFKTLSQNKLMARYTGHRIVAAVLEAHMTAKEIAADKIGFEKTSVEIPANKQGGDLIEAQRICELYKQERQHELPHKNDMDLVTIVANALRVVRMQNEPDFYSYDVFCVTVGDFAFACLPGEQFTETRNKIEDRSPFENMMVIELANCKSAYFPTTEAYSEGGYEVATTNIGPDSDNRVISATVKMLEHLK